MLNLSDRRLWHVYAVSFCLVISLGSICPAENLLINSDFKRGKPGDKDFGWELDLAKGEKNECTVVRGRSPESRAIRIRHYELGSSQITQQVAVRPWRWYVAEVWVNSTGMYPSVPGISLGGGRDVSGWRYSDDQWHRPKPGWRIIRAYTHSADSEQLKLSMGGGYGGELLFSEPVVRECSLVEAASYYPYPSSRHPALYGLSPNAEKGEYGYAMQRGNICRVARDFPNPLHIIGRMDTKAPEARVSLVLPPGIRFRKFQYKTITPKITDLPDGSQHLQLPAGGSELVVDADLEPGERAIGYVYYEWKGGYQLPRPVVFEGVELPNVTAPKRAVTALDVYGYTHGNWENDKTGLSSQEAMVRDMKRLGFNRLQIWGGDARPYAKLGIEGATSYGGSFAVDAEKYPDSQAVLLDGRPYPSLMCPSYRGVGLESNPWLERVRGTAAVSSCLTLDDEFYEMSSGSANICYCDRCMKRWQEWLPQNEPGLAVVDPKRFSKWPARYPEHHKAWLRFRCDLVAERCDILRKVFHEAVKKSGVKTTPQPMLGAFINDDPLKGLHSNNALSGTLDYLANMLYYDGDGVRKEVADLAPRSGGKLLVTLGPGYANSPPGDARSQVLEAVMGGSKGFIAWNYNVGMTTGHLVDMAGAIKMFAPVEDVILDGQIEPGYTADKDAVHLLARKQGQVSVLLVSDYSPNPGRVQVTVPGQDELEVVDLFTDEMVARLDAGERTFEIKLRPNFRARLYHLRPASN